MERQRQAFSQLAEAHSSHTAPPKTILLTATVIPSTTYKLRRVDPKERLQDYAIALDYWSKNLPSAYELVILENSLASVNALELIVEQNPRFHLVRVEPTSRDLLHRGRGAAELKMILDGMSASGTLRCSSWIIKVTGRLVLRNPESLFRSTANEDVCTRLQQNLTYADARAFAATPEFIDNFLACQLNAIDDTEGLYLEHGLARATCEAIASGRRWRHPARAFHLEGRAGSNSLRYPESRALRGAKDAANFLKARAFASSH